MTKTSILINAFLLMAITFSETGLASLKDDIAERIAPVGSVCMAGDDCATATMTVATSGDTSRSAEDIYNSHCLACHNTGAAGAPKKGDREAWQSRLTDRSIDVIYTNAIQGYNAMPAKGLCMNCSDEDIKKTVDYVLENSSIKLGG